MTGTHPQNRRLGYARVSTYGQTLDAQLEQLRGEGCTKIFREKVTGARADRRELNRMLGKLAPGEVVSGHLPRSKPASRIFGAPSSKPMPRSRSALECFAASHSNSTMDDTL